jgi:RHS repeat-associated protein
MPNPGIARHDHNLYNVHNADNAPQIVGRSVSESLYAPILGRFLSTDPIDGGSANDYEYTAGDPINRTEYNGTEVGAIPFMDLRNWL